MEPMRVERLDHLGVIASAIKDLGLIDMINARLMPDAQEVLTPGEALAAMILKGLGFANRPLSLTPNRGRGVAASMGYMQPRQVIQLVAGTLGLLFGRSTP